MSTTGLSGCAELQKRVSEQDTDPGPKADNPLTATTRHFSLGGPITPAQLRFTLQAFEKRKNTFLNPLH